MSLILSVTEIFATEGVNEAREKVIDWMIRNRVTWNWRDDMPRAVVALYLASHMNFNGTSLEEELMVKQLELKVALALLRSSLTNSELSMFINALLVTCHNPRNFYGYNLVQRLKTQVEETQKFTHPLAYLALCNANETWPSKANSDLNYVLSSDSEYPFIKDLQAIAILALSCKIDHSSEYELTKLYQSTIEHFKQSQFPDGSFGNVYTTALITQALMSSDQENLQDWKLSATLEYLIEHMDSSSVDFLSTYLTLPILNGKTLIDISKVDCSANPRKHGDDLMSEVIDYLGPKMRVQYSLYVGDEKDVIHTLSLIVPENFTAFEVMDLAQSVDAKYEFDWKTISGQKYVYQIAGIVNDPEAGKFWLLHLSTNNNMESFVHLITTTILCRDCQIETALSGKIEDSTYGYGKYEKCWTIVVPEQSLVVFSLDSFISNKVYYRDDCYVLITAVKTGDSYKFNVNDTSEDSVRTLSHTTVTFYRNFQNYYSAKFTLTYYIKNMECTNEDSFQCDDNFCIPQSKVCDGVKDCKNGSDEIGCETGVLAIQGVKEARKRAIDWMKRNRTDPWNWRDDMPRAVVALYLASHMNFNGTSLEEELMAKQAELKVALALLRSSLTNSELSMFINALLVTCHNPRHFYGNNLVKRLKTQVEETLNSTHPLAYLALCNANETWPAKANSDLNDILSSDSEYPFIKDLQAMAILALSCKIDQSTYLNNSRELTNLTLYHSTVQHFKKIQFRDGSFGNVYTTALITQALLSSGEEDNKNWKLNATIKYLIKQMNSSSVDFLSTYLTLPILNAKSLMDISKIDCSANPRKHGDDPISEVIDYLGPKMRVQYSLYVGDDKDFIHTMSLRVPENYTAFEVMELAQSVDPKYKFDWKTISEKKYVYQMQEL
ncbi:uncharacterized protein CG3556 [Trichonephila clavata]|uniref:Uncharacterized protein CG3556 n=1 Tax=Trichonephila clavata TaxID=2740835 RepID=A0A8X6H8N8_TRICU|nr:uncharacterized protein CG3556 [Trichonephila clavata]